MKNLDLFWGAVSIRPVQSVPSVPISLYPRRQFSQVHATAPRPERMARPRTISDDAINMDTSTDEAPIEAAPATTGEPKAKLDNAQAKETGGPDKAEIKVDEPPTE